MTCERSVFDPRSIFRMANFGLSEELLRSPSIWLCIGCQRCTEACSQLVKGHLLIEHLQQRAIEEGFVDPRFPRRLQKADQIIYARFLDEIDGIFNAAGKRFYRGEDVKHLCPPPPGNRAAADSLLIKQIGAN